MLLQTFLPPPEFSEDIDSVLVQEDWSPNNFANRSPVKVLPTSMTVIGIQYGRPMRRLENGIAHAMGTSGLTGLQTTAKQYISTGNVGTLIVRFKPGGLSRFTRYPIHEFQDRNVSLDLIFPPRRVQEMEERIVVAADASERVGIVLQFLRTSQTGRDRDRLILQACSHLQRAAGAVPVERLATAWHMSRRTLERKFNELIGVSPKKYAGIVRFQHAVRLRERGFSYLDIVEACGYADHAHLAKDFRAYAGCAPEPFFRSRVQPELTQSFDSRDADSGKNHRMYG